MAKPIPSPAQVAAINAEIASLNNQSASLIESANAQTAIIVQKGLIDDAFKDLFDWYNIDVIGSYDGERRAINGSYIASPVNETDLVNVSLNPPAGRLVPTPPTTAIVRISEFDGTAYTSTDTSNELQKITNETQAITYLTTGVPGGSPTVTATTLTTTVLTPASTTLGISDAVGPASFAIGNVLVVVGGGDAAVVTVTSVTPAVGLPPPYDFTLGITVVIPPTTSVPVGGVVKPGFAGFSNGERTTKTASDPTLQPLMNSLVLQLQTSLNARLTTLTAQLVALNANDDPDGVANITTAKNNAIAAQNFINAYLPGTDISDTGVGLLTTEYGARTTYLSTRVSQIIAAYTGQTENYYDERYNTANNRGDTSRGTLRSKSNAVNVQTVLNGMVSGIASTIASLNSIL